ncbi:MAG TPA: SHOCT domain-containing protein [Gammaproteobacteria bacterium]|nr:SHOCT domain-containing protein [Gammaproteobacteria bacterium]
MGQYGYEWMPGYGMGYGFGWIFMVLVWALIIVGIVAMVKWVFWDTGARRHRSADTPRRAGLQILQERYARGEIEREEYLQKKEDLGG